MYSKNKRSVLEIDHIVKFYENKPLLNKVCFKIYDDEIVCLLGPSGSGKSTLLRIISGLESFEHGKILWHKHDLAKIPTEKRHFGLMFQDYALFPHLNVFDNVAFGLRTKRLSADVIKQKVNHTLKIVQMTGFETRKVQNLSGGEQQRIALARTLAPEPRMIMLDEPLGALDRKLREQLIPEIRQILKTARIPAIYVTHDREEAFSIADQILVLHDGSVIQSGPPEELYLSPVTSWMARFLGLGNILQGIVHSKQPLIVKTALGDIHIASQDLDNSPGKCINLLLRFNGVEAVQENNKGFKCTVEDSVFQGNHFKTIVKVHGEKYQFDLPDHFLPGANIRLLIKEDRVGLLEACFKK